MTFTTREKILYLLPLIIAQTILAHLHISQKTGKNIKDQMETGLMAP